VKKHNPQAKVGPEWPALEGDVAKFCAAETKTAKFDWLKEHDVPQAEAIVKKIDLVDGARDFGNAPELNLDGKTSSTEAKREVDRVVEGAYAQLGQMQNEAVDRMFESFLRDWVSKPPVEMTSVAKNYFAFGARGFASTGEVEDRLLRARLRDRGLARDPNLNLPKLMKEPKGWIGDSSSAFVFPRDRRKPFLVGRAGDGGKDTSIVLATFRNAPHDVHIFSTQQQGDSVRITGWQTLAFP